MKYLCIRKCYYQRRLWSVGETLQANADEKVIEHFKKVEKKVAPAAPKAEAPKAEAPKAEAPKAEAPKVKKKAEVKKGKDKPLNIFN